MRDEDGERDGPPGEDRDRLLVRPYIGGPSYQLPESGRPPAAGAGPTAGSPTDDPGSGEAAAPPEVTPPPHSGAAGTAPSPDADAAETAPLPVVPRPAARPDPALDDRDRRQVLWLVGVGVAIALAAVAGLILLWPGGGEDPPAADGPATLVPAPEVSAPAPSAPPASAAAPATTAPRNGPSATRPGSPATTAPPTTRPAVPPPATTPAEPTLAAPPATDRTGPVTTPGGRCLDVAGGIVFPGSPLAVRTCNGTLSQRWTLAADGTLRVGGSCATAEDAGVVEVAGCGDAETGQWRAGPGGTLVGVASGRCLTDTAGDAENNARVGLAPCGAAGQVWTLP